MELFDEFILACEKGYSGLLKKVIHSIPKNYWMLGFDKACYHGHVGILNIMFANGLSRKGVNWNSKLELACKGSGNIDTVKLLIKKGASNFYKSFIRACSKGYLEIIKLFIAWRPKIGDSASDNNEKDIKIGIYISGEYGKIDIFTFLMEKIYFDPIYESLKKYNGNGLWESVLKMPGQVQYILYNHKNISHKSRIILRKKSIKLTKYFDNKIIPVLNNFLSKDIIGEIIKGL
jgi:hypothetical protein